MTSKNRLDYGCDLNHVTLGLQLQLPRWRYVCFLNAVVLNVFFACHVSHAVFLFLFLLIVDFYV